MSTDDSSPPAVTTRPPVAVPGRTGRRPWSTMLLREWAAIKYPGATFREQIRLGPTEESVVGVQINAAFAAMLRNWNWYADGLIVTDSEVLLIEAKVQPNPSAIGQVLFYRQLMISTPELAPLLAMPFQAVALFAESDNEVTRFARGLGVRVETYTPTWIVDYLTQVQFRRRSTPSPGADDATA